MMRKSSIGSGRQSLSCVPLRVRNESNTKPRQSTGFSLSRKSSFGSGSSFGMPPFGSITNVNGGQIRKSVFGSASKKNPRLSRGSGIGMRNGIVKDPRPLSDKAFQHKCIKNVLQFLTERNFPYPITPKLLQSPTTKDFLKIYEFIYSHIVQQYRISKKPEEDIPRTFKCLNYPFMISKSSLACVGSPHTWPGMLAALCWLVEIIMYCMSIADNIDDFLFPVDDGEFDTMPESRIFFNDAVATYEAYLEGYDEYAEQDATLAKLFKERYQGMAGGIDDLLEENSRLARELELLEQDSDRLKSLRQQHEIMLTDDQRFVGYLNELEGHRRALEQQVSENEEEYKSAVCELKSIQSRNEQMQQVYDMQEFTPADVERIRLNRRELHRQTEEVEKLASSVDQEIWTQEMGLSKDREKLEMVSQAYNKLGHELQLIPIDAKNAFGVDYELKTSAVELNTDFIAEIKPALTRLRNQMCEVVSRRESEKIEHQDQVEHLAESLSYQNSDIKMLESKLKRAEEEREFKKQTNQSEMQQLQDQFERVQQELSELQAAQQESNLDPHKELHELHKWAELQIAEATRQEQNQVDFLSSVLLATVNHKEGVQKSLLSVMEYLKEELQKELQ
ncbi:hypothetical protein CHS0354_006746 [Potamilus streckersoni]|uniref:Kinetochore protein NDC80 n=1 Tax=Potamilus streckersoni TaxID=2493646 RepID=A0AAE0RRD2_9BIVA|nr:hypothetical protein CHS0354_006746 [Potamilus streckersoni]